MRVRAGKLKRKAAFLQSQADFSCPKGGVRVRELAMYANCGYRFISLAGSSGVVVMSLFMLLGNLYTAPMKRYIYSGTPRNVTIHCKDPIQE